MVFRQVEFRPYLASVVDLMLHKAWIGGNCVTQMLRAMWPSFGTLSALHFKLYRQMIYDPVQRTPCRNLAEPTLATL